MLLFCLACLADVTSMPMLDLPAPSTQLLGSQVPALVEGFTLQNREATFLALATNGNIPDFLRTLQPVTVTDRAAGQTRTATFFVCSDYLALGQDQDYLLLPLSPVAAQRVADQWGCLLPTPKMVDAIYRAAEVKLVPAPIPPSPAMTTPEVFAQHNAMVRAERARNGQPLGTLVAGHKKDVVISATLPKNKVAIYGWHNPDGTPIQPLYRGHSSTWVDYSHGIRLVHQSMVVNGQRKLVREVLADPQWAGLISDEGVIDHPRYSTEGGASSDSRSRATDVPSLADFSEGSYPGEIVCEFDFQPEVRVQINAPREPLSKPIWLIAYALPNGNTIEQTVGKRITPGDDWHFDIQHIGAQTRFLRNQITHRNIVVVYLEAASKSWPAWRRKHGDTHIPALLDGVKGVFPGHPLEIVLTGHSGGGSLTFGYLNTVNEIPAEILRIAFLDSNYAYDRAQGHHDKLVRWLNGSDQHMLAVFAYHDSIALLNGKTFVSESGGTWGRSHAMLQDLSEQFTFMHQIDGTLRVESALGGRIQFLLKENPERKILHTVQVERNGFIHALLTGTPSESKGYEYLGPKIYDHWIEKSP